MKRRRADPILAARVARALEGRFGRGKRRPIDREAVLERVRAGTVIKARPPEPGMPCKQRLDRERREDPTFRALMRGAIAEARRRRANRQRLAGAASNAVARAAERAVPAGLGEDLRGDVVGELVVMLLEGRVALDGDLTSTWKQCRAKLMAPSWKEVSLNAPLPGTEGLTRLDLLSSADPWEGV